MTKLRQLGCLFAVWCVVFSAQAHWQANWLVGVTGGYSQHNGQMPVQLVYSAFPFTVLPQTNNSVDGFGKETTKGLLFGYRSICNRWLWDAEFNVDLYRPDKDFYFNFSDQFKLRTYPMMRRYKHGPAFGISGRFGYVMSPFFIGYVVAGLETNKDKLEITLFNDPTVVPAAIVMQDYKQQLRGILGFGAEFPVVFLSPCFSIRAEYNYHTMDKSLQVQGGFTNVFPNPQLAMTLRPKFNSGKVAFIWNFA